MKKQIKKIPFIFWALASFSASAVNFSFHGEIQDKTCEIKTSHKNLVVILPTISKNMLQRQGDTAGQTAFKIELDNCKNLTENHNGKLVYAFFNSDYLDQGSGTLKNAATKNKANNVNIQLTNEDGSAIFVANDKTDTASLNSYKSGATMYQTQTSYSLNYTARYYATGRASAGWVESFGVFTVEYK